MRKKLILQKNAELRLRITSLVGIETKTWNKSKHSAGDTSWNNGEIYNDNIYGMESENIHHSTKLQVLLEVKKNINIACTSCFIETKKCKDTSTKANFTSHKMKWFPSKQKEKYWIAGEKNHETKRNPVTEK
jgi:hypothetical protein